MIDGKVKGHVGGRLSGIVSIHHWGLKLINGCPWSSQGEPKEGREMGREREERKRGERG